MRNSLALRPNSSCPRCGNQRYSSGTPPMQTFQLDRVVDGKGSFDRTISIEITEPDLDDVLLVGIQRLTGGLYYLNGRDRHSSIGDIGGGIGESWSCEIGAAIFGGQSQSVNESDQGEEESTEVNTSHSGRVVRYRQGSGKARGKDGEEKRETEK